jgi:hypothetical protein
MIASYADGSCFKVNIENRKKALKRYQLRTSPYANSTCIYISKPH